MAAAAPPSWKVQAMEAREKEKMFFSIQKKIRDLNTAMSGMSMSGEADLEEKKAKLKEERAALAREAARVSSEIKIPDYSGITEAERAAEAERLRQEAMEDARCLEMEGDHNGAQVKKWLARLIDVDPKQGGIYLNRMSALPSFDYDKESPIGPMRFTRKIYQIGDIPQVCDAVNILSVKITCSDVGFPIEVYGSVIARDNIDLKCVNLFRRDRDNCQLVTSKDKQLILTGPKRGLLLLDNNYVETDLKIKDYQGRDRELSKGVVIIRGMSGEEKHKVETKSIATRLSTVDVLYDVAKSAVEGTVAIRVLQGEFHGTITARTSSILKKIVLYDSNVAGANTCVRRGVIQLMRSAVCVNVLDMLIIDAETSTGKSEHLEFTPKYNGGERVVITLGATKVRVRVAWSIMDR